MCDTLFERVKTGLSDAKRVLDEQIRYTEHVLRMVTASRQVADGRTTYTPIYTPSNQDNAYLLLYTVLTLC